VRLRIGFRTVAIVDGVFTVNGRPVKLRGVNRHEFSPDRGRAVTRAEMLADVLTMKRHNINAVRTSHYPPHPAFLDLCDEYGLWVIDECDLETHGFVFVDWRGNPSDDARWQEALVDRMRRTVERDKNHPSILMWSLGNESGTGRNLAAMAAWTRQRDPSRPIHYEHDRSCADVDVYSRMYATHEEVAAIATRSEEPLDDPALDARRRAMPFLQCEYAHAMGNGPGGLLEYQELFESSPRCMGGFVWEWIDHGLRQRDEAGRERFAYGGDFGEPLHDGNFVADGLLFPDRAPSPGLEDFAAVISPVRVTPQGRDVRITNRYDVCDLGHVAFGWTLDADGFEVARGDLAVPALAPGESVVVALPPEATGGARPGERWVTVTAVLAADERWAPAGHVLSRGQVALDEQPAVDSPAPTGATPTGASRTAAGPPGSDRTCSSGAASSTRPPVGCCGWAPSRCSLPRAWTSGGLRPTTTAASTAYRWRRCGARSAWTGCGTAWWASTCSTTGWSFGNASLRPPPTSGSPSPTAGRPPPRRIPAAAAVSGSISRSGRRANFPVRCRASASGFGCPAIWTRSPGSAEDRGRRTRTPVTAPGWAGSPATSTGCRRRTCFRRRTAPGRTCVGRRSPTVPAPACASRERR
jgi:beta-galactosidase